MYVWWSYSCFYFRNEGCKLPTSFTGSSVTLLALHVHVAWVRVYLIWHLWNKWYKYCIFQWKTYVVKISDLFHITDWKRTSLLFKCTIDVVLKGNVLEWNHIKHQILFCSCNMSISSWRGTLKQSRQSQFRWGWRSLKRDPLSLRS